MGAVNWRARLEKRKIANGPATLATPATFHENPRRDNGLRPREVSQRLSTHCDTSPQLSQTVATACDTFSDANPLAGMDKPPTVATVATVATVLPEIAFPDLNRFEEVAAVLEHDQGQSRDDAEASAARLQGYADAGALHRATVARWEAELKRLAASPSSLARRVLATARRFWADGWPLQAARLGWDAENLFGVHPTAPEARIGAQGLVVFIATGKPPPTLIAIDDTGATLVTTTGTRQRFRRWRTDSREAVPIWAAIQ